MTDTTESHRPHSARDRLTAWWDRWDFAIVWGSLLALSVLLWWFIWRAASTSLNSLSLYLWGLFA